MKRRLNPKMGQQLYEWVTQDPSQTDKSLDERIPDYVLAELTGEDAKLLFPAVHHYILTHPHASQLYTQLLKIEQATLDATLPQPNRAYTPDLSFLAPTWKEHFEWATTKVKELNRQLKLDLPNINGVARRMLEKLETKAGEWVYTAPNLMQGPAGAINLSGAIREEEQWIGALYNVVRQHRANTHQSVEQIAMQVAQQTNLPKKHHILFVKSCVLWLKQS